MSYNDTPAAGSKLSIQIASVMTEIPGLSEVNWDGLKRAVRNVSVLSSTSSQKKPGLPDLGQIKGKVNFDPNDATHKALRNRITMSAAAYTAALDTFELEYADGFDTHAKVTLVGFVSEFGHGSGTVEDGTWSGDLTIEINSAVFADGVDTP
jgi:hypothetical protein